MMNKIFFTVLVAFFAITAHSQNSVKTIKYNTIDAYISDAYGTESRLYSIDGYLKVDTVSYTIQYSEQGFITNHNILLAQKTENGSDLYVTDDGTTFVVFWNENTFTMRYIFVFENQLVKHIDRRMFNIKKTSI